MKKFIFPLSVCILLTSAASVCANDKSSVTDFPAINKSVRKSRSAAQKTTAGKIRRNFDFSSLGNDYASFKNKLSHDLGLDYALDISYMGQRGAPNGKKNAMQTIISPSVTWTVFNNALGTGNLNAAYSSVKYGGVSGQTLGQKIGVATEINDYTSPTYSFDELYFSYRPDGSLNWLTVAAGQFPLYNFDGSAYNSNQQVNFVNYALSQNASSTYPTASLGMYAQITPNDEWNFVFGAQDATNIDGHSIKTNNLSEEHYTSFVSLSYAPLIHGLGTGQYSILLYNQPGVKEQTQTTNGWSINLSQNIGDKFNIFARINGVSGNVADISRSWVAGGVYNNPLDRNPLDQIGLAFAYNKIDKKAAATSLAHDGEKIIEAYWAWGISKWMTLTPDVQFYINPAENQKSDYAAVFTLRSTFFF